MQKYISKMFILAALPLMALLVSACSAAEDAEPAPSRQESAWHLRMDCNLAPFGAETRAGADEWKDGAAVYLQFTVGTQRVAMQAVYSATDGEWTLDETKTSSLMAATDVTCEAYYFENATSQTSQRATIGSQTIVYGDEQASCLIDEDSHTVIVRGKLSPLTARLRITGEPGAAYSITGLSRFTAYNAAANTFSANSGAISGVIGPDGSSEFIYALFAYPQQRTLAITAEGVGAYQRTFATSVLRAGSSGHLTLPTTERILQWQMVNTTNGREITLPTLSSVEARSIGSRVVTLGGSVSSLGNGTLLDAGFVVSKDSQMTSPHTYSTGRQTPFQLSVTGLEAVTKYYVRAYARNERGASLSAILAITTSEEGTIEETTFGPDANWDDPYATQGDITQTPFSKDENYDTPQESQGDVTQTEFGSDENWD